MPKMKTRKAAAKRFKITGTGKVIRNASKKRHLLEHKSPSSKRKKRRGIQVGSSDIGRVEAMLPGYF